MKGHKQFVLKTKVHPLEKLLMASRTTTRVNMIPLCNMLHLYSLLFFNSISDQFSLMSLPWMTIFWNLTIYLFIDLHYFFVSFCIYFLQPISSQSGITISKIKKMRQIVYGVTEVVVSQFRV